MLITMFKSLRDPDAHQVETTWDQLTARATAPREYPDKPSMPLIKLAMFGTQRAERTRFLRHESNMTAVWGVEGDYDAGAVAPEDAITSLGMAGLSALVYTTPSHTEAAPRWRVLAPLSLPLPVAERRAMVARVNGVLGGVLADESFVPAQAYYWGRVAGVPYRALSAAGRAVDLLPGLASGAVLPPDRRENAPTARNEWATGDPVVEGGRNRWLFGRGAALRRAGLDEDAILYGLLRLNADRCQPPLPEADVRTIAASAGRYPPAREVVVADVTRLLGPMEALQAGLVTANEATQAAVDAADALADAMSDEPRGQMLIPARIKTATFNLIPSAEGIGCSTPVNSRNIHPSAANALVLVRAIYKDVLWFDPWGGRGMYHTVPLADHHYTKAAAYISALPYAHAMSKRLVKDAMDLAVRENFIDPIVDWLVDLRWDGEQRLDNLATLGYGCADNSDAEPPLESKMLRKMLIASVARQFSPGTKFDYMVVLEGAQGTNKSRSLRALFGEPYVADWTRDMQSKDFQQQLQGHLCVEVAELASFGRSGLNTIKALLSATTDTFRLPYAVHPEAHPRRVVLVGTSNTDEYLTDATGNRRFWPVVTGVVDVEWIRANRDQLFAEAVAAYRGGESWYFEQAPAQLVAAQSERVEVDVWTNAVLAYVAGREEVTVADVLSGARAGGGLYGDGMGRLEGGIGMPIDRQDTRAQMRVATILRLLGWIRVHTERGNVWRNLEV